MVNRRAFFGKLLGVSAAAAGVGIASQVVSAGDHVVSDASGVRLPPPEFATAAHLNEVTRYYANRMHTLELDIADVVATVQAVKITSLSAPIGVPHVFCSICGDMLMQVRELDTHHVRIWTCGRCQRSWRVPAWPVLNASEVPYESGAAAKPEEDYATYKTRRDADYAALLTPHVVAHPAPCHCYLCRHNAGFGGERA